MFPLGHLGITLATVKVSMVILDRLQEASTALEPKKAETAVHNPSDASHPLASAIDYRLLLLGAILPDLIDKPLGKVFLREQLANGQIFSHTLLFTLLLLHIGFLLSGQGRRTFLSLFIGVSFHLAGDIVWLSRGTLLWPLYGWAFPKGVPLGVAETTRGYLSTLATTPVLLGLEAIGGMILLATILSLLPRARWKSFVKRGNL